MINNPYGFRIMDFMKPTDTFEDLENIWFNYLKDCKIYFVDEKIYKEFIERFVEKFYFRFISVQTTTEFKIRFKNFLRSTYEQAKRLQELNNENLKLFYNNYQISENELNNVFESVSLNENKSKNESTTSNENISSSNFENLTKSSQHGQQINENKPSTFSRTLESDTPSQLISPDKIFNDRTYVVKATETQNGGVDKSTIEFRDFGTDSTSNTNDTSHSTTDASNKSETSSSNKGNANNKNNQKSNSKTFGYNGDIKKLINDYISISLDVINFYLNEVENYGLFKSILY